MLKGHYVRSYVESTGFRLRAIQTSFCLVIRIFENILGVSSQLTSESTPLSSTKTIHTLLIYCSYQFRTKAV